MPVRSSGYSRNTIGVLLIILSAVAFAVGPTGAKLAFENGSNTLTVITLRGAIGAALLGVLIVIFRQGFRISRIAVKWCVVCSAFSALMIYGFIGSVAYIPISVAVLIFFTHPLSIALIVHWRGGDRLTVTKLFLGVTVFIGLALALGPAFDTLDPFGVALAALAAVTVCGAILCGARAQQFATSTQVNCYVTAITGAVFALLTVVFGAWSFPVNATGWLGIAGAGIGIAVALLAFFAAFRYLSPVRATMMSNIEPLLSILFAVAVLGERLQPLQWAGVAVMISAIVLFEASDRGNRAVISEA